MSIRNIAVGSIILILIVFSYKAAFSENAEATAQDKQEFDRDIERVRNLEASLSQSGAGDINMYKTIADSIDQKWRGLNREYHARLILEICRPFGSSVFDEGLRYKLRRKYALSALEEPDSIPLILEMELIGRAITFSIGPGASTGEDFAQKRAKDTAVRLHAWKRLLSVIDPNWDSTEAMSPIVIPPDSLLHKMGSWNAGMDPKAIKDSTARAEYEELIRLNNEKRNKYSEQYAYRPWLNRFPKRAERYIIDAYSTPPFAIEELRKMLGDQLPDQAAKARIIAAVEKNMRESPKGIH
jgi:hypothetical protein